MSTKVFAYSSPGTKCSRRTRPTRNTPRPPTRHRSTDRTRLLRRATRHPSCPSSRLVELIFATAYYFPFFLLFDDRVTETVLYATKLLTMLLVAVSFAVCLWIQIQMFCSRFRQFRSRTTTATRPTRSIGRSRKWTVRPGIPGFSYFPAPNTAPRMTLEMSL